MSDLFAQSTARVPEKAAESPADRRRGRSAEQARDGYSARDIEVLEGLEPVRRRPGMYIGGTDDRALHHLVAEVLDNAMDEAVAGHASWIELALDAEGRVTVRDNGRGIPIDEHPKFPGKSALEVILTTLHSGGKFSNKVYATSGGLHGVGLSVVNALSEILFVEVARDKRLWTQEYRRGVPRGPLTDAGPVHNRRGTAITFQADPEIFGERISFRPDRLFRMARSKAYLYRGVEIRWRCAEELLETESAVPAEAVLHFPGGLGDFLASTLEGRPLIAERSFSGMADFPDGQGRVEWAIAWPDDNEDGISHSYCNTVPTPQGGTHEAGLRAGLLKGLKAFGEMASVKRARDIIAEDITAGAAIMLSVFIPNPQFQGQTKDKLSSQEAARLVETVIKDHVDHWLSADPAASGRLLDSILERAEDRARRKAQKEMARKTPTQRIRLPGKLIDCARTSADGTEIFLVEGDSAGGTAKAARQRETQAILPLRGKILNVASASAEKLAANQEISDLGQALGCGTRRDFDIDRLRYERVIIMTDADVDGAHIASLLITFFFREMRGLIDAGRLFLAQPPLYRIQQGGKVAYARDDAHKDELLASDFDGRGRIEFSRFKGLGEMPAPQLRETTMHPDKRTLLRVAIAEDQEVGDMDAGTLISHLMGRKPELRLRFIQEHATTVSELDV